MQPKLVIEVEGENVLVTFLDKRSYRESRHILEGLGGTEVEFEDRAYACFYDHVPYYNNHILNIKIREEKKLWKKKGRLGS